MADPGSSEAEWPEAMAEVTECRYDMRAGRAIAFGLPSKKHFHITYNYLVGDGLHVGECYSEKAMPQGSLFPVRYDPDLPHVNRAPSDSAPQRIPLIAIGIAGSIVLSLAWLLFVRGCA